MCVYTNIEVLLTVPACYSYRYDTDDEEVDDSECEEDEVNGNENDSDEEEGKTPFPLVMYTVYGLLLHLGHLCCKHGKYPFTLCFVPILSVYHAALVPSTNQI